MSQTRVVGSGASYCAACMHKTYFITHFLYLVAFRNKLYCRRMSIDNFTTYFFGLLAFEDKLQSIRKIINSFITHFLILVAVRNKNLTCFFISYKRVITHLFNLILIRKVPYYKQQLLICIFTNIFSLKVIRNRF